MNHLIKTYDHAEATRLADRAEATRLAAVQHESDCGHPGIFSDVTSNSEGIWTLVIEHYDTEQPFTRIGTPCRYTVRHNWQVARST